MGSFFQKYSIIGIASNDWSKENHFSNETTPEEVSAASNPSPKSPLDVDFEKETGVTAGLGLVPHLARLWEDDPYDRRIVFGNDTRLDLFSRSLIELSIANTFELISLNPYPPAELFSYPSTPSSLFSPISHTTLIGSKPDMDLPDEMPLDPEYFLFIRDENHEINDQPVGFDVLFPTDSEFKDDPGLSVNRNEHIYDDYSVDGMRAHEISHLAHEEENSQGIAHGTNPITTPICNNCSVVEQPRYFVGGLSATFGVRANRPVPNLEDRKPTEDITMRCCFCKKSITNKEQKSVKQACNQCRKVEDDIEEDKDKAETKASK